MRALVISLVAHLVFGLCQAPFVTLNWDEGLDISEIKLGLGPASSHDCDTYRVRQGHTSITIQLDQPQRLSFVRATNKEHRPPKVYFATGLPTLVSAIEHHEITLRLCPEQDRQENITEDNNIGP